jgi:hypothetical protein
MKLSELQPTYTMRDMFKVLARVEELTRENAALRREMEQTKTALAEANQANAELSSQLFDLQSDLARTMTAPRVIPISRSAED